MFDVRIVNESTALCARRPLGLNRSSNPGWKGAVWGAFALLLWCGLGIAQEIPWHLGRVDGTQAAPSAINTAGNLPGPHAMVVAVIDSGVFANHPSLQGQLLPGYDMVSARQNVRKPDQATPVPMNGMRAAGIA